MKLHRLLACILGAMLCADSFATKLGVPVDRPFRTYSVEDGLNQKAVTGLAQDQDGVIWVATFGGLNRFDGQSFTSFTTRQGLRQNLIQHLMVDSRNRVWAGDVGGGLTVIDDGVVTDVYEPVRSSGVVRDTAEVGDTMYIAMQPGGLRQLSLSEPNAAIEPVPGAADTLFYIVPRSKNELIAVTENYALLVIRLGNDAGEPAQIEQIAEDIHSAQGNDEGRFFVGSGDGRVGELIGNDIEWYDGTPAEVSGLSFQNGELAWVFTERHGMSRFGQHGEDNLIRADWSTPGLVDTEGVLWVATRSGLSRYLGERFSHYTMAIDDEVPDVFAIERGLNGDYWLGTSLGIVQVTGSGQVINLTDQLGLERREVRDLILSPDGQTLYAIMISGQFYQIDLAGNTAQSLLGADRRPLISLLEDHSGRMWMGTYYGQLYRYDPADGSTQTYELGEGAGVYPLTITPQGTIWFLGNFKGLFRLDTNNPDAEPEQVLTADTIGRGFFTDIAVTQDATGDVVWFSSLEGGVFQWRDGALSPVIDPLELDEKTVFSLQPLADGTLVLATSRGVYRLDPDSGELDFYAALDGFVALEGKVHARLLDDDGTLWIGTTGGVTAMNTTVPMATGGTPRTLIVRRTVNGDVQAAAEATPTVLGGRRVMIEYAAISTRRPEGIEFSYRLTGQDQQWSAPTATRSIGFSSLAPGDYVFEVRSRFPAGDWGEPQRWAFVVPTPFYLRSWFIALALLLCGALTWGIVQLRLRSIARLNKRLRQEVLERTESIDQQRQELQTINEQLSSEITERQRADALRADMEARFTQAYQNSPVGMALLDVEGLVYDANPTLKGLFWPTALAEDRKPLLQVVVQRDRPQLSAFLDDYASDQHASDSMEVDCVAHNGDIRRIDFLPSAVRDHTGELQYIVLVANDVTESRAMTRQLEYQARYDELTGLVNRRAFADQLKEVGATARERGGYLMFLDLDQFKVVNDTCGHAAGDELLRKVAKLLTVGVREQDTVARLGGDEFALIMVGCSEEVALRRAEHIRQSIADLEFLWDAKMFRIGVSIGVVPIKDSDRDLDELQQLADAACYAAKDAGRNRVHLVADNSDEVHVQRGEMRWVQRLSQAIDTNSFQLFGQRIVPTAPRDGERERVEVLLRMQDRASNRLIPPGAFLPAAERYGMVGRLDQWVMNRIIELLSDMPDAAANNCRFWLNLSGASVSDRAFSRDLVQAVANSGLAPGVVNFEITETAVIRKIDDATQLIAALREMGCHFALDDFGSGLSSFGYLKQLNVDVLKVDGQFIRDILHDPTDRIFVKSIIDIAHTQGMRVVAEFVEDDATLDMIREMGCDFGQGFGIHRPEPLINLLPAMAESQSQSA